MKRKFAALLLSAAMLCTLLTGCSDSSSPTPSNPNPPASSSSGSTSTPSDDNNNNSGNDNNNSGNSNTTKPGDSDTDSATLPSVVPVITYNSVFSNYLGDNTYQNYFCFTATNPNMVNDFTDGSLTFTYKDSAGNSLGTLKLTLPPIPAGDTITFGTWKPTEGTAAASCTYTYEFSPKGVLVHDDKVLAKHSALVVSDFTQTESSSGSVTYTGKITNTSSINMMAVNVDLYYIKDGKPYLADYTDTITNLAPGETKSFLFASNVVFEMEDYDSLQVIAYQNVIIRW